MKRFLPLTHGTCTVVLAVFILTVALAAQTAATSVKEQFDDATKYVNRTRGLTLSILKQVKQVDRLYRSSSGTPVEGQRPVAREQLAATKLLVGSFNETSRDAEDMLRALKQHSEYADRASDMEKDVKKYRKAVDKTYGKAVDDFGEPPDRASYSATPIQPGARLSITGEATGTLGTSGYKRPNVTPEFDQSTTEFGIGARGKWIINEKLNVDAKLARQSTVERIAQNRSNVGAALNFAVTPQLYLTGGFDWSGYNESDFDTNDFGDFDLFVKSDYRGTGLRGNAMIKSSKRSYDEKTIAHPGKGALALDYSTTQLLANAILPAGTGELKIRLNYLSKSHDYDRRDYTKFNPSAVWEITPGGSEMGFSYEILSHSNLLEGDPSSYENQVNAFVLMQTGGIPRDSKRIKAHYKAKKREGATMKTWGPSVALYSYPDDKESDFKDLKFDYNRVSFENGSSSTNFRLMYRLTGDKAFDFVQLEIRRDRSPSSAGIYNNTSLAARFYTEQSHDDSLANMAPAHTLDANWRFGLNLSASAPINRLSVGPVIGGRMYFDTERDDKLDGDLLDVDFLLKNPRNFVRIGVEATTGIVTPTGFKINGKLGWQTIVLYNSDPKRSTKLLTLDVRGSYQINSQFFLDGNVDFHRTRADEKAFADLDRTGIRFQVRYLIDVQQ